MAPENITPSDDQQKDQLRWKYPGITDKVGRRVSVDWSNITDRGPDGEYKIIELSM